MIVKPLIIPIVYLYYYDSWKVDIQHNFSPLAWLLLFAPRQYSLPSRAHAPNTFVNNTWFTSKRVTHSLLAQWNHMCPSCLLISCVCIITLDVVVITKDVINLCVKRLKTVIEIPERMLQFFPWKDFLTKKCKRRDLCHDLACIIQSF